MVERYGSFDCVAFTCSVFEMRVVPWVEMLILDEEVYPALIDDPWVILF